MAKQYKVDTAAEARRIMGDLKAKKYKPIYLLCGEEPFYIDLISDYIEKNVLTDDEKEFNLTVLFGADTNIDNVVMAARQYPMMSEYQVIIVKEAQSLGRLDALQKYLKQPTQSSIIVLCYKHGKPDARQKAVQTIPAVGELFETARLSDAVLPRWVEGYVTSRGLKIQPAAAELLVEFVGNDLTSIVHNVDKLKIIMEQKSVVEISSDMVSDYTGISREYNNIELKSALAHHDIMKANKIAEHFAKNPKANSVISTIANLFYFFSNLLAYLTISERDNFAVSRKLNIYSSAVPELALASKYYSTQKVMRIIGYLRQADAQSKGFRTTTDMDEHDILRELIFKILH